MAPCLGGERNVQSVSGTEGEAGRDPSPGSRVEYEQCARRSHKGQVNGPISYLLSLRLGEGGAVGCRVTGCVCWVCIGWAFVHWEGRPAIHPSIRGGGSRSLFLLLGLFVIELIELPD